MPMPSVPFARVEIHWDLPDNNNAITVLWYTTTWAGPINEGDNEAQALAASVHSAFTNGLKACLSAKSVLSRYVIGLSWQGSTFTHQFNVGDVGDAGGDCQPNFVAAVLRKRVAAAGRKSTGRWFLPGVPDTYTEDNQLNMVGFASFNFAAQAFAAVINTMGGQYSPVMLSPTDSSFKPIISASAVALLGTMRTRKGR